MIEREIAEAGAGEVRLAVKAAPVHPSDIASRERGVQGVPPPWVVGWDCAGVVESIGPEVDGLAVGDEVMAIVVPWRPEGGAQTELLVAPAGSVVPIPEAATLEQASTLPMNAMTALSGLEPLGLTEGQTLAVTGGAGLLASYVIGIAKRSRAPRPRRCKTRGRGARAQLRRRRRAPAWRRDGRGHARDRSRRRGCRVRHGAAHAQRVPRGIREGGSIVPVRGWDGDDVEDGHPCPPRLRLDGRRPHRLARGGARARLPRRAAASRRGDVSTRAGRGRAAADGGRRPARPRRHVFTERTRA